MQTSISSSKYINYILNDSEKNKKKYVTDYYLSKDYEQPFQQISKHPTMVEKLYSEDELIRQRKIKIFDEGLSLSHQRCVFDERPRTRR